MLETFSESVMKFLGMKYLMDGRSLVGTPNLIAPEVLHCINGHSFEVDIWCLGVAISYLLLGQSPFKVIDRGMSIRVIREEVIFPADVQISSEAKQLILDLLKIQPEERLNLNQILDHGFFRQFMYIPEFLPQESLTQTPVNL
mmetsp:Transcript_23165/g.26238  ORF Transcript_23165/g.26238 Transcript_23165/m.26238 type:complete len:143 (-) Transcript_23165:179-607(-)